MDLHSRVCTDIAAVWGAQHYTLPTGTCLALHSLAPWNDQDFSFEGLVPYSHVRKRKQMRRETGSAASTIDARIETRDHDHGTCKGPILYDHVCFYFNIDLLSVQILVAMVSSPSGRSGPGSEDAWRSYNGPSRPGRKASTQP